MDLKVTLWQIVPYMGMESLQHPLAQNKSGLPSAHAYHVALESLLCTRSSEDGWRVLNETRSSCISHPGLLDIVIASNGLRCGIHLLAKGDRFGFHVANAATYMKEQGLQRLLVVNFATNIDNIVSECPVPPAEGVDVVQVLLNFETRAYSGYELKNADTLTFLQCYEKSEPDVPGAALGATMGASHWRQPVPTTRGITSGPGDAALTIGVSWNGEPASEVKCAAHSPLDDVLI
jgi:hypothetical protein